MLGKRFFTLVLVICFTFIMSANVMADMDPEIQKYIDELLAQLELNIGPQEKPDWGAVLTVLTRVNVMPDRQALNDEAVTIWGNTDGLGAGATTYEWDIDDDGTPEYLGDVTNPHQIPVDGVSHLYATTGTYTATLIVYDDAVEVDRDSVVIEVFDPTALSPEDLRVVNVNMAIEDGLRYLYRTQSAGGSWSDQGYTVGPTAEAVLAFENQGYVPSGGSIYAEYVQLGLDWIFADAVIFDIGLQDGNDPDTDGDGIGVGFSDGFMYETGMAMTAIVGSGIPGAVVNVPGSQVDTWPYLEVLRDNVDFCSWAQYDAADANEGGWRYYHNYGSSDNSVSPWVALGLAEAEELWGEAVLGVGIGIVVPTWVKDQLGIQLNNWIDNIQDASGGSEYTPGGAWVNFCKTPGLLIEGKVVGDNSGTSRMVDVQNWCEAHWNDSPMDPEGHLGNGYAMYNLMKGCRLLGIDTLPGGRDWYTEYADYLIPIQNANGSWPHAEGLVDGTNLNTAWFVLVLSRGVVSPIGVDLRAIDSSAFPTICLKVFVDSETGRSGWLGSGDFTVKEDGITDPIDPGSFSFDPGPEEYRFCYDTHNPEPDGTLRTVTVIVNDPDGIAADTGTYTAPECTGPYPDLVVEPSGYNVTLPAGECEVRELTITNVGCEGTGFTVTDFGECEASPVVPRVYTLEALPSVSGIPQDQGGKISSIGAASGPVTASLLDLTGVTISYIKTHKEKDPASYATLIHDLQIRGAEIDFIEGPITPLVLKAEDILWIDEWGTDPWTEEEIFAIKHWIKGGGTILIHGDEPGDAARLAEILGIAYTGEWGEPGITNRIHPHPATKDHELIVEEIEFGVPKNSLENVEPQEPLIADHYPIVWYGGEGETGKVDIVFLFDSTGSMGGEIDAMKARANDFASDLAAAGMDARLGLIEYRDNGETLSDGSSTSPAIIVNLTSDVATFQAGVNGLVAGGGGDWEECGLEAYELALTMGLRSDARRIFIQITDAPVHYAGDGSGWSVLTIAGVCDDLNAAGVEAFVAGPDLVDGSGITDNQGRPVGKRILDHAGDPKQLADCTGGLWADIHGEGGLDAFLDEVIIEISGNEAVKVAEYYQYDQDDCKYERGRLAVVSEDIFHDELIVRGDNLIFANLLFDWLAAFKLHKRCALWLAEGQPKTGYLAPGETTTIPITFTTTGTPDDSGSEYHANILVYSHDPDENIIEVPATLTVIRPTVQIWAEPDEWHGVLCDEREIALKVDTHGNDVTGVELHLSFDATYIEILDAEPETPDTIEALRLSDFLEGGTVLQNEVNDGQIDVAVAFMEEPASRSGLGVLGYINCHIISPPEGESVTTTIGFDFDPPDRDTTVSLLSGTSVRPSVPEPAVTVIIDEGMTICGNVLLQGREDQSADVHFQLLDASEIVDEWDGDTDFFGHFCKDAVPYGTWDVTAKERHYLRAVARGIVLPDLVDDIVFDPETGDEVGTLRGGDCNDDNVLNIADFSQLAAAFGSGAGDPGYDEGADINADGAVTIRDFGLLASNYGKAGVGGPVATAAPVLAGANTRTRLSLTVDGILKDVTSNILYVPYGEEVEVTVFASDASDLHGYSFKLSYDAEALKLVSTGKEKGFLKKNGSKKRTLFLSREPQAGTPARLENSVITACSIVGKEFGVSDKGAIVSFRFIAIGKGNGTISLKEIKTSDHFRRLNSLEGSLATIRIVPKRTAALQNYPNPFNPDTWIPYQLSSSADVTIRIYSLEGSLIKKLSLGHKEPGFYVSKSEAAYWDGRNDFSERVSSGVYFYHIQANDFYAVKKMIVVK